MVVVSVHMVMVVAVAVPMIMLVVVEVPVVVLIAKKMKNVKCKKFAFVKNKNPYFLE